MPQYEYIVVLVASSLFGKTIVNSIHWPNGSETNPNADIAVVLSNLGLQGWEVVTSTGDQPFLYWTLKRQIIK